MNLIYNLKDVEILEFYPYPSHVSIEIAEYDEFINKRGDHHVKELFEAILSKANKEYNRNFLDNKIAFKIRHVPTNTTLFVGMKDSVYRVGLKVENENDWKVVLKSEI